MSEYFPELKSLGGKVKVELDLSNYADLENETGTDTSSFDKKVDLASIKSNVDQSKIKNIEDKIPDITNLATKTTLNAKINEVKGEIPSITNLATKTALNAVENKIPNVSNLVKKNPTITQKLMKLKRKLLIVIMINILLLQNLIS